MTLKQSRKGKKDMQNTDLVTINEETKEMIIKLTDSPIEFLSLLTSILLANLDTLAEHSDRIIAKAYAFATAKSICDEYDVYDDLQKYRNVRSDSTN